MGKNSFLGTGNYMETFLGEQVFIDAFRLVSNSVKVKWEIGKTDIGR